MDPYQIKNKVRVTNIAKLARKTIWQFT